MTWVIVLRSIFSQLNASRFNLASARSDCVRFPAAPYILPQPAIGAGAVLFRGMYSRRPLHYGVRLSRLIIGSDSTFSAIIRQTFSSATTLIAIVRSLKNLSNVARCDRRVLIWLIRLSFIENGRNHAEL